MQAGISDACELLLLLRKVRTSIRGIFQIKTNVLPSRGYEEYRLNPKIPKRKNEKEQEEVMLIFTVFPS